MKKRIGLDAPPRSGLFRKICVVIGGAAIYALLYAFCSQVDESGLCNLREAGRRFLLAMPAAVALLILLFRFVIPWLEGKRRPAKDESAFCTPAAFALIFCCYVPMFLFFFPGSFTYDSMAQVHQIAGSQYYAALPLLHTLTLGFFLSFSNVFDSMEICGAMYSVTQMLLLAGCFALVCASISRSVSRKAAWIAALFYGLYPAHMAFASNCTKDVLFSGFFALFLALCFEEVRRGNLPRRRRAMLIASGTLACMLRSNLMLAAAVWALLLLIKGRRYLRQCAYGLVILALALGGNAALAALTHASETPIRELLSVPVQQLVRARLYAPECFTQEQAALMDSAFRPETGTIDELYLQYEPTISDPIKGKLNDAVVAERLPELAQLWISVGHKCPGVYLDAFLNLTLPALYPYETYSVRCRYIEIGSQASLTAPYGLPPLSPPARFEGIRNWLMEHVYDTGADDVPVLRWLFNTGFIYWLVLLAAFYELYSGNGPRAALMLLPVILWALYLLGPVMQGRYLYPFVCVLPLFAARSAPSQGGA